MRIPELLPSVSRRTGEGYFAGRGGNGISPQGCNWWKCGGVAISCAVACASGVGTAACVACLGESYDSCRDCF